MSQGGSSEDGGYVESEHGGRSWKGSWTRSEEIGKATVEYLFGCPRKVFGALLEDGSRGDVHAYLPNDDDKWRLVSDDRMVLGRLLISDIDVLFVRDGDLMAKASSLPSIDGLTALEAQLIHDDEFMRAIQDLPFAITVYESFCNRVWRASSGDRHQVSWRSSAGFVADARMKGECYLDFYCADFQGIEVDLPKAEAIYRRLGWSEMTDDEARADREEALRFLSEAEGRDAGDPDAFWEKGIDRTDEKAPFGRLVRLRASGRVTEGEFDWIHQRI